MKPHLLVVPLLLGIACNAKPLEPLTSTVVTGGGQPGPTTVVDGVVPPVTSGLVVHEWGTFTSVTGSDGKLLEGMHHEEEALPAFVYSRAGVSIGSRTNVPLNKGLEGTPTGVTQKLETPVIYFYGDAVQAHVRVDFPRGVVSEWFPAASSFGPAIMRATSETAPLPTGGFMEWQVDLMPGMTASSFPAVPAANIWSPSRRVASLPVRVGSAGENEQFIFYRGLGTFELPFTIEVGTGDEISIHNRSAEASPAVFLLRVHEGGGAIVSLGSIAGGASLRGVPLPQGGKEHDLDVYVTTARERISEALVASGLYPDEAQAMVDTWSKSYFQTFGLRLLYVVPREWTDTLLPLAVEPTPAALVRTLVGRIEVLTTSEERAVVGRVGDALARGVSPAEVIAALGRLAEPKLRRAMELTVDPAAQSWCRTAIAQAALMP